MTQDSVRSTGILNTLDVALFAFALAPPEMNESAEAGLYRELMFARTSREGLRRSADREAMFAAHRLRVALQLAPIEAISYVTSNPMARWKIVNGHLTDRYTNTTPTLLVQLARRIAATLADWQEPRAATSTHHRSVWLKSAGKCCSCHYNFRAKSSPALKDLDPYKPYFSSPNELTAEEVDHIVAISGVGTNGIENLQLLCRWCNFGKRDGLGVDIRREAEFAAVSVHAVPRSHVASMFYMTLAAAGFMCEHCDRQAELTMRPRDSRSGFLLSNLISTCYNCLSV